MLKINDLAVGYGGRTLAEDINFQLHPGEIVTLIGPNGAGKSTILKTIIQQLSPIRGTVYLDGQSMTGMSPLEIARRLSVLMTERVHPELMTCWDVVSTGRYPYTGRLGLLTPDDREKVWQALALVHGEELANQDFSHVSDGQRQRVLLARALCQEPDVLVLDEPTSFLDIRYKLELLSILKALARKGQLAILMSLHELELAQRISDYVLCVHNRTIERWGQPEEIFTSDYIMELYETGQGSYNPSTGCLELERVTGEPQVFVIGGGGSGIPVYRRLQRQGIPFAAGILHKNDLDYPVAKALAVEVVSEQSFTPIHEETFDFAKKLLSACSQVLCPLENFGPMNDKNQTLKDFAAQTEKLKLSKKSITNTSGTTIMLATSTIGGVHRLPIFSADRSTWTPRSNSLSHRQNYPLKPRITAQKPERKEVLRRNQRKISFRSSFCSACRVCPGIHSSQNPSLYSFHHDRFYVRFTAYHNQ